MKQIVVKAYSTRRAMSRGVERMAHRGYLVQTQSGEFTRNPFVLRWNRRKVVVTFRLDA